MSAGPGLLVRSVLFTPGHRADLLAKVGRVRPDVAVPDLEDAVAASAKAEARTVVRQAVAGGLVGPGAGAVFARLNPFGTPAFDADVDEALHPALDGVVLPKLESADQLEGLARRLDARGLSHLAILGGVETAAGVEAAPTLGHPRLAGLYFGAEDFIADVGGERTRRGLEVLYARSRVALAGRLVGVPVIDQVVVAFRDLEQFAAEAEEARQLGYAGKLCIHPSQVALANEAFTPTPEQVARARRIVDAAAAGPGVVVVDGQMIDRPLVRQAEAVLARGARSTGGEGRDQPAP